MNISAYEFLSILQAKEAGQVEEKKPEAAGSEYLAVLDYVRSTIAQKHANEMSAALDDEAAARTLKSLIMKYTTDYMSGVDFDREALVERIYQDMAGLGLLSKYLFDPNIEEININGYNTIEIIRPDRTDYLYGKDAFASPEAALDIVKRMVRMGGKLLDAQSPQVDSFIGSGTRINATIPPLIPAEYGVVSSIRKQIRQRITKEMIVNAGTATEDMLDFLVMCLCNHVSIGLAGATGSGKSALQSFILNEYITTNEAYNNRIYLVEDTQELNLLNYDVANDCPARIIPMLTSEGPVKVTWGIWSRARCATIPASSCPPRSATSASSRPCTPAKAVIRSSPRSTQTAPATDTAVCSRSATCPARPSGTKCCWTNASGRGRSWCSSAS